MIAFIKLCWTLALGLLGLGFMGALHPALDSLSVGRPIAFWIVLAGSLALMALRELRLSSLGLIASALTAQTIFSFPGVQASQPNDMVLYQKNMWLLSAGPELIAEDIRKQGADIVTLQEVTRKNAQVLDVLGADYPSQLRCEWENWDMASAVASKWPVIEGTKHCLTRKGLVLMQVISPVGPLWIGSVHLNWPWPKFRGTKMEQRAQIRQLMREVPFVSGPIVIGGDFNHVVWSHTVHDFADRIGNKPLAPIHRTFDLLPYYAIPIDHVMIPSDWSGTTEMRPKLNSDHRGIVARFRP